VKQQNARSDAASSPIRNSQGPRLNLTVLNADDRIPEGTLDHQWVFDFWQDAGHVRGIWRRTTIADFASKTPHWQTLLDVDELDRDTRQNWVWKGSDCTPSFERCLISLSLGGGDAQAIREFDPKSGKFSDDGLR